MDCAEIGGKSYIVSTEKLPKYNKIQQIQQIQLKYNKIHNNKMQQNATKNAHRRVVAELRDAVDHPERFHLPLSVSHVI